MVQRPMHRTFCENQLNRFKPQIPLFNTNLSVPIWGSTKDSRDFQGTYRERLATEWSPLERKKKPMPSIIRPPTIYYSHIGLLPNYCGHVPGIRFRFGKTFGGETVNAKEALSITYFY